MPPLKSRRESHGLTQIALAMGAGVSLQVIRKYEQTGPTLSPEYERVIDYIEELDRKRERETHPAYELRVAIENVIEDLRTRPEQYDPKAMALIARFEELHQQVAVMQAIEEPGSF